MWTFSALIYYLRHLNGVRNCNMLYLVLHSTFSVNLSWVIVYFFRQSVISYVSCIFLCSSFPRQKKPSQRKMFQCRSLNTARPSLASISLGTQWWKCPSERCEVEMNHNTQKTFSTIFVNNLLNFVCRERGSH